MLASADDPAAFWILVVQSLFCGSPVECSLAILTAEDDPTAFRSVSQFGLLSEVQVFAGQPFQSHSEASGRRRDPKNGDKSYESFAGTPMSSSAQSRSTSSLSSEELPATVAPSNTRDRKGVQVCLIELLQPTFYKSALFVVVYVNGRGCTLRKRNRFWAHCVTR